MSSDPTRDFDVVILGGALSGAAMAVLLRRDLPDLTVAVVEKAEAFDAKVGEATTEMSAMFLTRRLALWSHLEREHLPKEGLRYWFSNGRVTSHHNASEAGGALRSAVPSFQLRRDVLDEHLLETAVAEGTTLFRPARVKNVEIGSFAHRVSIESADGETTLGARWVIDATGRVNFLGRRLGLIEKNERHPTAAMWARWRDVRHIDDIAARGPLEFARKNVGSRRLGTNHYMGFGYWIWVIPLANGETSIGIVWDRRIVPLHESRDRESAYVEFLRDIPALRELLDGAEHDADDFRYYGSLAYSTKQYAGEGWALIGDAAVFLDPYYSPGLDHAAFSIEATLGLIRADVEKADVGRRIAEHNEIFLRSYDRFFEAAYRDKYLYMDELDLVTASFLLDTAHYYIFVVMPAYRILGRFHWMPVLGPKEAFFSYHLMRFYSRRFRTIALLRREAGEEGRRNDGRRITIYFNLGLAPVRMLLKGFAIWMKAEADALRIRFRLLFRPRSRKEAASPFPVGDAD